MRVLLTGLCLQGNKGGPAIALSLMRLLKQFRADLAFTLSVPPGLEWEHEKRWADIYGVDIIPTFMSLDVVPPFSIRRYPDGWRRAKGWVAAARKADAVIDMSAIAYVGPPEAAERDTFLYGRFVYFNAARFARRPFLGWTESLGPFTGRFVPRVARMDLKRQPVILCRGEDALANVNRLLPGHPARSFPDVAITLDYDREKGRRYLERAFPGLDAGDVVTVSPNAVSYVKGSAEAPNSHVRLVVDIVRHFTSRGRPVCLVPHTLRPGRHDPRQCDLGVCREVLAALGQDTEAPIQPRLLHIVEEDLSPIELKSIIAASGLHAGARYHSVVAALSSGTPCVALAWHPKYADILAMYHVGEFAHPAFGSAAVDGSILSKLARLEQEADAIRETLRARQQVLAGEAQENGRLFCEMLSQVTAGR